MKKTMIMTLTATMLFFTFSSVGVAKQDSSPLSLSFIENGVHVSGERLEQLINNTWDSTERELLENLQDLVLHLSSQKNWKDAIAVQSEIISRFASTAANTQELHSLYLQLGKLYELAGDDRIKTFVNDVEPALEIAPFIIGGRSMIPIKLLAVAMDTKVTWQPETRSVLIQKDNNNITLFMDQSYALINGVRVEMEVKPITKDGHMFVPLRFLSEYLNSEVTWEPTGKIIIIHTKK